MKGVAMAVSSATSPSRAKLTSPCTKPRIRWAAGRTRIARGEAPSPKAAATVRTALAVRTERLAP